MSIPYIAPKMPLNGNPNHGYELLKNTSNSENFNNCSTRHNQDSHSLNCRFSYTTWCPACEHHDINQSHYGGRRRCKSEGMDMDRSDGYYYKVTQQPDKHNNQVDGYNKQSLGNTCCRSNTVNISEPYPKHTEIRNENISDNCRPRLNGEKVNPDGHCFLKINKPLQSMNEWYYNEMEPIRNKIHDYPDSPPDGKRLRQNSESDYNNLCDVKRPRDNSPIVNGTTPRKILPSVPPTIKPSVTKAALVPRQVNIPSSESATSISSDSEYNDSACDEEEFRDEHEGDVEAEGLVPNVPVSKNSISPSHVVSHSLNSISLSDSLRLSGHTSQHNIHPGLRASLFPHIPPYINFCSHDSKALPLPAQIQRLLKWKLSTITPVVVRKTISNSNFKLIRKANEWCGTWGKHMKSICFQTIRDYQKINHFPGTFQIGRKDKLWKNLFSLMSKFGKKEFGFIPRTYILPQDTKLLRSAWEKNYGKDKWIVKPPASARGTGIKVIHKWTQIPKKCPLIVQKYIAEPYLINGSKFDLRLYVLVTSINPLCVYLYDNGLVRFASVKYSNEMSTLADRYMHLTNYSINKLSSQYTQNEDASACQGHKWTLRTLWSYLERENKVDVKALWANLVDLVIKTVISGESAISRLSHTHLASSYCSYELFGVDVLLDENLKPWLLEVNISPSLHSSSPLDLAVKGPLVKDLMNIAGYHIPNKLPTELQESLGLNLGVESGLCYDRRLYTTGLSVSERRKHLNYQQFISRDDYLADILDNLTPDDVRHLVKYEDELTQIGNFQKVFPTTETYSYHQFFEAPRYYNMLFDAWELKQHNNRLAGIQLLKSLCQEKVHLDVSQIPPKCAKASASQSENALNKQESNQKQREQGVEEEEEVDTSTVVPEKSRLVISAVRVCDLVNMFSTNCSVVKT
uniref:Tubulin polyglutamylase TTLL4 n=1 Tax=Clastoptera arizonana TaxID=38151 RepID=A0A1B6DER8_9HEMI